MKINCIRSEIKTILINEFDIDREFNFDTLLTDIGIDSLKSIDLVLVLENHYGFEFDDEKLSYQTLRNINSISEYIVTRIDDKIT